MVVYPLPKCVSLGSEYGDTQHSDAVRFPLKYVPPFCVIIIIIIIIIIYLSWSWATC